MITPYGVTRFEYLGTSASLGTLKLTAFGTALLITQPDNGKHLYLHADYAAAPPLPEAFDSSIIPAGLPVGTLDTDRGQGRNTFYWGPRQLDSIGNTDVNNWTWAEFKRAHTRQWLGITDPLDAHRHISDTLSWEQAPSPDGMTEGQVTWYDYAGKSSSGMIGTGTQMPAVIARVLPNGTTSYQYFEYNSVGHPTRQIETYTKPNGTIGTRTNVFEHASNQIDMTRHIGPQGEQVVSNRFNAFHQVTNSFNALNEQTESTYDSNRLLIRERKPGGLTRTNIYDSNGRLQTTIDLQIGRTDSFTYANGLVHTHSNELGLMLTNTWDGLHRLRRIDFRVPNFPNVVFFITNSYDKLDLTRVIDRMGFTNSFVYDSMRRLIFETNELGRVTQYAYCTCGSLNWIKDAADQFTSFFYDQVGRLTMTVYPGGYAVTNTYNLIGQIIRVSDSSGTTTNWFNNQGLLVAVSNAFGRVQQIIYDIEDRPVSLTDEFLDSAIGIAARADASESIVGVGDGHAIGSGAYQSHESNRKCDALRLRRGRAKDERSASGCDDQPIPLGPLRQLDQSHGWQWPRDNFQIRRL